MESQDKHTQLMDYLYGEMSSAEKAKFLQEIESDDELSGDLKSYLQLRSVVHEQLPQLKAPKHLTQKVFRELGIKKPWYEAMTTGFWRPALAGAFVVLMAVGITTQWDRFRSEDPTPKLAQTPPQGPAVASQPHLDSSETDFSDRLLANRRMQPSLRVPVRSRFPSVVYPSSGSMVSLAGFGNQPQIDTRNLIPETEIQHLDLEAERAVAQFLHQQALRMRAVGDFKGAAQELAELIKTYPFYPYKLQAMAQRVDSLFRAGDFSSGRDELKVLRELSPTLAYLIERRWGPAEATE